jgi:hypothetical protein
MENSDTPRGKPRGILQRVLINNPELSPLLVEQKNQALISGFMI